MFTKLSTSQPIPIGLVLAMAFLLVLGSNRLDQRHLSTIQTTLNSVYKDRVVVQDIIYQLTSIVHAKELRVLQPGNFKNSASENQKIKVLLTDFEATELTSKESKLLDELKVQFSTLRELENTMAITAAETSDNTTRLAGHTFEQIQEKLDGLSQIQLQQSGQLTQLSNKSFFMHNLLSKLEVAFLVIIGIALMALIIYPLRRNSRTTL